MEKRFDNPRTVGRMAARHAATVAVFRNSQQLAFGVVTNLSVSGACIVTDNRLAPGSYVDLKLSLYRQPRLHEIGARVVWSRPGGAREKGFEDMLLHGVYFMRSSALQKSRLHTLLTNEDFVNVFRPSGTEFDFLQDALAGELDELGSIFGQHDHKRRRHD